MENKNETKRLMYRPFR